MNNMIKETIYKRNYLLHNLLLTFDQIRKNVIKSGIGTAPKNLEQLKAHHSVNPSGNSSSHF